ncbi:conjugal transfer protein TrbH [Nitrosomonas sp. Is35]|uniref:conjugal transfer protein TrbH n=1 Tax=unclassified Nitrosomonas TaxID=2609265 RepID=UPI00294ABE82|nr:MULTISPECIES: conjugal transfer protein TrbH [unclassified Nitrosomonas]MDV6342473.1 conjugal transfer protein TrbH [Nitrosomonas sp. Is24]MDV6348377.1 conjugal transfer protein TrbH [Nitrosomonas sp. Is35]
MNKMITASNAVFILMLVLLLLNGCATHPYGNFIQNPSIETSKVMADDVAAQIVRLYPAANTQFNLRHVINDPFGHALIENLRLAGFAVQEVIQQPIFAAPNQPDTESQKGLALSYIIDQSGDLYHVKLMIDDMRLSRAFSVQGDSTHPAGLWVRKE